MTSIQKGRVDVGYANLFTCFDIAHGDDRHLYPVLSIKRVLWERVRETRVVEKTACKGKYAMCNCGEVTVNGKVVVPASPVQLGRRMTGLATGREWTCWRTGQSRDGPWEERRKRGELLARCVGCSEFSEEVSEEDGVEFLVCLELCECRRGGVARKVRAVFLVDRPVGMLALTRTRWVRPSGRMCWTYIERRSTSTTHTHCIVAGGGRPPRV